VIATRRVDLLIAEDNVADAELILESLRAGRLDDQAYVVRDGVAALDFLFARGDYSARDGARLPRVVFLDIKLPLVDGIAVLRALRADTRTRHLPVVMLTSSLVERDVATCYALGVNSYVQKPVEFDQFRAAILQAGRYWLQLNAPPPHSLPIQPS
jgi:two-component system response regulator